MKHLRSTPASIGRFPSADVESHNIIKRMGIVLLALCLVLTMAYPVAAFGTTASQLADAQARYDQAQAKLDAIAAEFAELSARQSDTLDRIESVQKQMDQTQAEIEKREKELQSHQAELAQFAVDTYKQDQMQFIDVLLDAQSFESFVTNWEFIEKINAKKQALIDNVRSIREELNAKKKSLEKDMVELEALRQEQLEQMNAMQARQNEVAELVASLDAEVTELTNKNNAEIAARVAESAANSYGAWTVPPSCVITGSGSASNVVSACYTTPSPGLNWCAAWVTNVFVNAGVGRYMGNACDMYNMYCYSSDLSELQPGMIVAVSSNPRGGSAGTIYGHVGIYIGNGIVMENIGYIAQTPISEWISWYSSAVTPRWGWLGGVALS